MGVKGRAVGGCVVNNSMISNFLLFSIAFVLGNSVLAWLPWLPSNTVLIILVLGAISVGFALKFTRRFQKTGVCLLGLLLSSSWALGAAAWHLSHVFPKSLEGKPIVIEGVVVGLPTRWDTLQQFDVLVDHIVQAPSDWPHPGKITLRWYGDKRQPMKLLSSGERWQFTVRLKRPRGFANPGSMDKEKLAFIRRISAEGQVVKQQATFLGRETGLVHGIHHIRAALKENIQALLSDPEKDGWIPALVLGTKEGIKPEDWRTLQNTGTAHLMAISGLHVGFVALLCFQLFRFGWAYLAPVRWIEQCPAPLVGAGGGMLGALAYAALAGLSVPTQRALIMVACAMLALLRRRLIRTWRVYWIAVLGVLLYDPFASLSIGFWLSFGAVGMMLYGLQHRFRSSGWWWTYGRPQWIAFVGLLPLSLFGFGGISFVSPLANMLAIPWVSFLVVPLALIGTLLTPFNTLLAKSCLLFSNFNLTILRRILSWMSDWQWAFWSYSPSEHPLALLCAIVGVVWFLSPSGMPARWLGIIWGLPLLLAKPNGVAFGEATVAVLDVDQGLSMVVDTQSHRLVFDTGATFGKHRDAGEQVVVPYLRHAGLQRGTDLVVISHVDSDHVGGLSSLLRGQTVRALMTSEPEVLRHKVPEASHFAEVFPCQAGQSWDWDGVHFEMLHPSVDEKITKRNNRSCVLKISTAQHSFLMTGDIEAPIERQLLASKFRGQLSATIIAVPHHGSKSSSSPGFIRQVNPQYAVVSAGYLNRYRHPRPEVVKRYQALGTHWISTVDAGAAVFHLKRVEPDLGVESYRVNNRHIWSAN